MSKNSLPSELNNKWESGLVRFEAKNARKYTNVNDNLDQINKMLIEHLSWAELSTLLQCEKQTKER